MVGSLLCCKYVRLCEFGHKYGSLFIRTWLIQHFQSAWILIVFWRFAFSAERAEDRIDVINVVRSLIELRDTMFCPDAELRHEACLQLAATQPAILDALLGRMLAVTMRNNEYIPIYTHNTQECVC